MERLKKGLRASQDNECIAVLPDLIKRRDDVLALSPFRAKDLEARRLQTSIVGVVTSFFVH
jgi:hypothetical protein